LISGITPAVAGAVLFAAVLHAGWNALAKSVPDRLVASALMGAVSAVIGAVCCLLVQFPAGSSWPFLVGSAVLQTIYLLLLTAAYARGEFGRVYPVARGTAPVVVTIVAVTLLGEDLGRWQLVGVAVVVAGIAALVLVQGWPRPGDGLGLAALTGVTIASYTLVDGLGVRRSATPLGYTAWLFLLHGGMVVGAAILLAGRRSRRAQGAAAPADSPAVVEPIAAGSGWRVGGLALPRGVHLVAGIAGGAMSIVAYGIVLWAQDRASLALVSALRETSVLFAGLLGVLIFGEKFTHRQTLGAISIVAGITLIQLP
jgi:drug/metabolite transporter (DMT)-like permease